MGDRGLRAWLARAREWARALKLDVTALWIAARDPRTPWYAKAVAAIVAGYAVSPLDLIPDFVPILGLIDDLVLLPLGIALAVRLIPRQVMREARKKAELGQGLPRSRLATALIVAIWVLALAAVAWWLYRKFR